MVLVCSSDNRDFGQCVELTDRESSSFRESSGDSSSTVSSGWKMDDTKGP